MNHVKWRKRYVCFPSKRHIRSECSTVSQYLVLTTKHQPSSAPTCPQSPSNSTHTTAHNPTHTPYPSSTTIHKTLLTSLLLPPLLTLPDPSLYPLPNSNSTPIIQSRLTSLLPSTHPTTPLQRTAFILSTHNNPIKNP